MVCYCGLCSNCNTVHCWGRTKTWVNSKYTTQHFTTAMHSSSKALLCEQNVCCTVPASDAHLSIWCTNYVYLLMLHIHRLIQWQIILWSLSHTHTHTHCPTTHKKSKKKKKYCKKRGGHSGDVIHEVFDKAKLGAQSLLFTQLWSLFALLHILS